MLILELFGVGAVPPYAIIDKNVNFSRNYLKFDILKKKKNCNFSTIFGKRLTNPFRSVDVVLQTYLVFQKIFF